MHTKIEKPVKIFLSYSTKDKKSIGEYKKFLEFYGLDVFLAHQDIVPSVEWQETIFTSLKNCDVFVPIVSKNFKESDWTDQESGIALALDKRILPVKFPRNPYGFLSRFQGLKGERYLEKYLAEQTMKSLSEYKDLKNCLRDNLIRSLKSGFDEIETSAILDILIRLNPLSTKQIDSVITRFLQNKKLHKTILSKYIGSFLIIPNHTRISNSTLGEFQRLTNWNFDS